MNKYVSSLGLIFNFVFNDNYCIYFNFIINVFTEEDPKESKRLVQLFLFLID